MQPAAAPRLSVSALAAEAGVPIARIKFYLREGVLPRADLHAERRGYYGIQHLQRLRLIFALRQVAGSGHGPDPRAVRVAGSPAWGRCRRDHRAGDRRARQAADGRATAHARAAARAPEVRALLAAQGTQVRPQARAVEQLAKALVELRRTIGPRVSATDFVPYLDAMCSLAERDFRANAALFTSRSDAALAATWGTVLWEPVLILLRRIAHEHVATQQLSAGPRVPDGRRP